MAGGGGRRKTMTLVALVVVVVFGAGFVYVSSQEPDEPNFCMLALPMFWGEHRTFTFEDRWPHGGDDCDGSKVQGDTQVLGADCKLRNGEGEVVAELEPNYSDGTCGFSYDAYPPSWQTA